MPGIYPCERNKTKTIFFGSQFVIEFVKGIFWCFKLLFSPKKELPRKNTVFRRRCSSECSWYISVGWKCFEIWSCKAKIWRKCQLVCCKKFLFHLFQTCAESLRSRSYEFRIGRQSQRKNNLHKLLQFILDWRVFWHNSSWKIRRHPWP